MCDYYRYVIGVNRSSPIDYLVFSSRASQIMTLVKVDGGTSPRMRNERLAARGTLTVLAAIPSSV